MKKTAIAILIAVLVVVIGGTLLCAGLSAVHFDFRKLDRTQYVTNTYDFTDPVQRIDVKGYAADVELLAAENGGCRVVSEESDREKYTVALDNGTLTIRPANNVKAWSLFSFKSPRISVYLPAGAYESLQADMGTGDVTADKALVFGAVDVKISTGDLTLNGVQADRLSAHGSTGDIRLSDMTPGTVDVSVSTGQIVLTNVVCSGDLRCESTTGDIRLTDVDGANLYLKASTGDITGTIRTPKTFLAHASTGSVRVPDAAGDGRCEAQTSTGDIKLSISGE